MQEMNYGCGSTVHARDLTNNPKMLYVGVGGGMELLQFAYFNRTKGGVIGLDVVDEMYITHVNHRYDADTFFTDFNMKNWTQEEIKFHAADERHPVSFKIVKYTKR